MPKFVKGQIGNPKGRPKDSGKAKLFNMIVGPHAEEIIKKLILDALNGDSTAMRLIIERLVPRLSSSSFVELDCDIAQCDTLDGLKKFQRHIFSELSAGRLSTQDLVAINETIKIAQDTLLADEMRVKLEELKSPQN